MCQPEKVLGEGGYSTVLEGVLGGQPVAIKWAADDSEAQLALVREFALLRKLRACRGIIEVGPCIPPDKPGDLRAVRCAETDTVHHKLTCQRARRGVATGPGVYFVRMTAAEALIV